MTRTILLALAVMALAAPARAQDAVTVYLTTPLSASAAKLAAVKPGARDVAEIRGLLPLRNANSFVEFVRARRMPAAAVFNDLLGQIDAARLNKMLAGSPGVAATGLVSRVVAPAVLGAAVEYGSILQETKGTVTTLRGNLLGVTRMLLGSEQFPSCPLLTEASCPRGARVLRAITGSVTFDDTRSADVRAADTEAGAQNLFRDGYRISAWGARLDLTPSNNLDDPKYLAAWNAAIDELAKSPQAAEVTRTISELFADAAGDADGIYVAWQGDTVELLQNAPADRFRPVLAERLSILAELMAAGDPAFAEAVAAVGRAYAGYDFLRTRLLTAAQTNKLSLEYTNHRPSEQPQWSNLRLIYSHQPTADAAAIITLNAAASLYHEKAATALTRLRDVQLAGQIDRKLGELGLLGPAVFTVAGYYQWMKDDALILVPAGTTAPGSGIELPDQASKVLGTKGHIGVLQAKLSITLSEAVKVPFSVTWATRKELIKEKDVRGQVGMTLDIDQLFH